MEEVSLPVPLLNTPSSFSPSELSEVPPGLFCLRVAARTEDRLTGNQQLCGRPQWPVAGAAAHRGPFTMKSDPAEPSS